ncbi:MAG: hypothetical protein H0U27_06070 [Nitrosopumilus sp.]|nr:hypothetical protein [Nitrosopumilus sp.]MBA3550894.1 hypothetical protein [Patescibacteria group bacterium]
MGEQQPKNPYEGLTDEEIEMYEAYMDSHPEIEIPQESLRDPEKEIAEFETFITNFEQSHNLEELNTITELTPEDAPNHPIREPARKDLNPIVALLNTLKKETAITEEKHEELKAKYKRLSQAVGIINRGIVDHTR